MPMTPDEYESAKRLNFLLILFGLVVVFFNIAHLIIRVGEVDDFRLGVAVCLSGLALDWFMDNNIEIDY